MQCSRSPLDARLAHCVERLWLHEATAEPAATRELCLPSARTRLVLRLHGTPMRRFHSLDDGCGVLQPRLQCCGLRRRGLLRSPADAGVSIGVDLHPGGSLALFGQPADRLADQYVALDDLVPLRIRHMAHALQRQAADLRLLDRLEDLLLACLQTMSPRATVPQGFDRVLQALSAGTPVLALAAESGLSHRAWLVRFRAAVGCAPREWLGLARFGRTLQGLSESPTAALAELALAAGFHDQAHLNRSFAAHAGITPGAYRRRQPHWPQHLLLG